MASAMPMRAWRQSAFRRCRSPYSSRLWVTTPFTNNKSSTPGPQSASNQLNSRRIKDYELPFAVFPGLVRPVHTRVFRPACPGPAWRRAAELGPAARHHRGPDYSALRLQGKNVQGGARWLHLYPIGEGDDG